MSDTYTYMVQCAAENFEDTESLLQVVGSIVDVDKKKCCIKTRGLDGTTKKCLMDMGASFWLESDYTTLRRAC